MDTVTNTLIHGGPKVREPEGSFMLDVEVQIKDVWSLVISATDCNSIGSWCHHIHMTGTYAADAHEFGLDNDDRVFLHSDCLLGKPGDKEGYVCDWRRGMKLLMDKYPQHLDPNRQDSISGDIFIQLAASISVKCLLGRAKHGPWGYGDRNCVHCGGEGFDVNCGGQIEKCRCLISRDLTPTKSIFKVGDRVRKISYTGVNLTGRVARVHEPELVGGVLQPQMVTIRWDDSVIPSTIPARWCQLEVRFGSIPEQSAFTKLLNRIRALLTVER